MQDINLWDINICHFCLDQSCWKKECCGTRTPIRTEDVGKDLNNHRSNVIVISFSKNMAYKWMLWMEGGKRNVIKKRCLCMFLLIMTAVINQIVKSITAGINPNPQWSRAHFWHFIELIQMSGLRDRELWQTNVCTICIIP